LLLAGAGFGAWFYFSAPASDELVLYGNVDQRQVELAFIDAERVEEILVQEGAEVRPGQVLARQESRRLKDKIAVAEAQTASAAAALERLKNGTRPEEIDQARAAVTAAQAEVTFAEAQYERFNSLWQHASGRAVSKQDVDGALQQRNVSRAKLNLEQKRLQLAIIGPRAEDIAQAEAVLQERQQALAALRNQLADAELKSPAHSVINRRLMEPGDMASPQRAVFSLAVLSPKWVRAYVAETDLGRIQPGMKAAIFTDSHPEQGIAGTIGFISSVSEFTPKAVETTALRTSLVYEVRIYVEDTDNLLRLGMPATVRFPEMAR
jgi:HlyD family secretion protein